MLLTALWHALITNIRGCSNHYSMVWSDNKHMSSIWRIARIFRLHNGSCETFLSTIMASFALGGLCRWHAKVVLHHAKMAISATIAQLGKYTVVFWNFSGNRTMHTYCRMINIYWSNMVDKTVECLWLQLCVTYWSVKTLYLTNGKYLFLKKINIVLLLNINYIPFWNVVKIIQLIIGFDYKYITSFFM